MKTVGIIVEYNPLHNGHLHHIEETRRLSSCDTLIAVMSSSFTQRGEPAVIDKFTRTKMALENGVDLVVELPFVFAVQNADIFAETAVRTLDLLGVDEIWFGSEHGDIAALQAIGDVLESDAYNNLVRRYLKDGNSYPTAADKAMRDLHPNDIFDQPNNILGIQYLLAGRHVNPGITFHTIPRHKSGYYDDIADGEAIQSATAIRRMMVEGDDISPYVPTSVAKRLFGRRAVTYEDFHEPLQAILGRATAEELYQIFHVTEGLEHRILNIPSFHSVQHLIDQILTRRYTNSKVRRTLAFILANVKESDLSDFEVSYLRVLGMNDTGRAHLGTIKKDLAVPLVTNVKEGIHPYLDIELRVSKLYSIASDIDVFQAEFKRLIF